MGTRLDVGPGVGGAEGRGVRPDHIGLETYAPRYTPPSYPPPAPGLAPRYSADEDAHLRDIHGEAPKYDGYNAADYLPAKDEKAPGYDIATDGDKSRDEDDEGHGPRVQDNNPFR